MNKMFPSIGVLILFLSPYFFCFHISSQNSVYYQYDKANGINSNTIYSLFQDSEGYLWVGTDLGLHRYNGDSFEEITIPEEYESLEVYSIWEHSSGDIWISTKDCNIFYVRNKIMEAYEFNEKIRNLSNMSKFLTDVWHNDDDEIVFNIRNSGSFKIDKHGTVSDLSYEKVTFLYQKDRWHIGANHYKGVDYRDKNEFSIKDSLGNSLNFVSEGIGATTYTQQRFSGSKNQLQYSLNSTLYSWSYEGDKLTTTNFDDMITSIAVDNDGQTWIGMIFGGLVCLDKNHENYRQILPEFTNDFITALLFDEANNLWVGTDEFGLIQIQPWMLHAKLYRNEDADPQVKSLLCIEDTLFIGYYKSSISKVAVEGNDDVLNVSDKKIGRLWDLEFIPEWNKLISINREHPTIYSILNRDLEFLSKNTSFPTECVLLKQLDGKIYGYGGKHVTEFDMNMKALSVLVVQQQGTPPMKDLTLYNDKLIGGSYDGLFEITNGQTKRLNIFEEFDSALKIGVMSSTGNNLFCGSVNNGLYAVVNGQKIHLDISGGLPSNNITSLFQDEELLYIGTSKGLVSCKISSLTTGKIDLSFLLSNDRIYQITSNRNNIFISSNLGVYQIPKNNYLKKRHKPKLELDYITKEEDITSLLNDEIKVSRNTAFTKISFKAIDINENGEFYYEYNIGDAEHSWIPVDNGEFLLPNLSAGSHNLNIRARRFQGPFSEISTMSILIPKLFYETWWFIFLTSFLILLLAILLYRFFRKRHQLELRSINSELRLNQQILQAKMNPHFIFNSLNTLKLFIKKGDNTVAENYLSKFSNLLRNIFEYTNSDVIVLSNEINYISKYVEMESQRFEEGINYNVEIGDGIISSKIKIPTLVIQPLVENAIWHGLSHSLIEKRLVISITEVNEYLIVKIIDNGVGMERSKDYVFNPAETDSTDHSMSKTKMRFELLSKLNNQEFGIKHYTADPQNKSNPGTICELKLPNNL